jgi:carbon-monoxide dehydrogenase medium subunit
MYTAPFRYLRPKTLAEAQSWFRDSSDARYIAGGQTLIPTMKQRLATPSELIDIGRIASLAFIRREGTTLVIGAGTPHADVAASGEVRGAIPALASLAGQIGDPAVRHRGTLGGSIVNNDPAADYPAAILALEAEIHTVSNGGKRVIKAEDFFVDMLTTALQAEEILTEVRITPSAAKTGSAYLKVPQPASGFAVVGVAAIVTLDASGKCANVRVGVTGAAAKAFRAKDTEAALTGKTPDEKTLAQAAAQSTNGIDANGDIFASAEYRTHLVQVYTKRALAKAVERARA